MISARFESHLNNCGFETISRQFSIVLCPYPRVPCPPCSSAHLAYEIRQVDYKVRAYAILSRF